MGNTYTKQDKITELRHIISEQTAQIQLLRSEIGAIKNNPQLIDQNNEKIAKCYSDKDYDYLVLSGGGIKGISFVGAIHKLWEYGMVSDPNGKLKLKGIAGASAGSIVSSLLAIGYSPDELMNIVPSIDFEKIFDDKKGIIRDGLNVLTNWGVCPGNYILELMGILIEQKTGNKDYTISDLYKETGVELVIVVTNDSYKKTIYLHPRNPEEIYANIPIRVAIRMSMSIPFAFEPYQYNNCSFVDGGVLDNYPLHVFDGEFPGDINARLNILEPNPKVLGIKIMTTDEECNYDIVPKEEYTGLVQYAISFINLFLTENERRIMTPSYWLRTINVVVKPIPLTQFDLSDEEKNELVGNGKKFVEIFFNTKDL